MKTKNLAKRDGKRNGLRAYIVLFNKTWSLGRSVAILLGPVSSEHFTNGRGEVAPQSIKLSK